MTELCLAGVRALLTFVSLLSNLYSVSSLFPKSEFFIMPNMSLRPGHLSSLSLLWFVYPVFRPCAFCNNNFLTAPSFNSWKNLDKQEVTSRQYPDAPKRKFSSREERAPCSSLLNRCFPPSETEVGDLLNPRPFADPRNEQIRLYSDGGSFSALLSSFALFFCLTSLTPTYITTFHS